MVAGAKTIRYDAEQSTSLSLKFRLADLWFLPCFCRHFNEVFLLLGFCDRKTPTIHVTDHSAFSKPRRAYLAPLLWRNISNHPRAQISTTLKYVSIIESTSFLVLLFWFVDMWTQKWKTDAIVFVGWVSLTPIHPFPDLEDPNTTCSWGNMECSCGMNEGNESTTDNGCWGWNQSLIMAVVLDDGWMIDDWWNDNHTDWLLVSMTGQKNPVPKGISTMMQEGRGSIIPSILGSRRPWKHNP